MIVVGSYSSLLQGVSQQTPRERQVGQLSVQENMLSDPVTGIRRRTGTEHVGTLTGLNADANKIFSTYMEIGAGAYNLFINAATGWAYLMNDKFQTVGNAVQHNYLIAQDAKALRMTSLGEHGYILNTEAVTSSDLFGRVKTNPAYSGFFYVRTGAFKKAYTVTIRIGDKTSKSYEATFEHITDETAAGSTPDGAATNLANKLVADATFNSKFFIDRVGAYVAIFAKGTIGANEYVTVSTSSGMNFMMASGAMNVALASDLPARLPNLGNDFVCSVGTSRNARTYFKWNQAESLWDETGDYNSPTRILNTPIRFKVENNQLVLEHLPFEGRLAGDDNNNPMPTWIGKKLTGMSTYQGRLVLLSGAYITLSAVDKPYRMVRSTVSDIRDDDPATMSANSASAASFEHAIQFNKDLVLFSKTHQAVIPALQTALTSTNVSVVMSGRQNVDTGAEPQVIGRTLMAATPLSADFFGVVELVPSQYAQSQYTPQTLTDHIPRYMAGRCRKIIGSNSSNIAMFLSSSDYRGILVHEYLWNGEERALMAWHHWTLPTDICSLHFARDIIVLTLKSKVTVNNATSPDLIIVTIDPKASAFMDAGYKRPFMDAYSFITVTNNTFTIPERFRDPLLVSKIRLTNAEGALAGEPVGIESINQSTWTGTTVRSFVNGTVSIGLNFTSAFAPTPPMMRDENDVVMTNTKTMLMRYNVTVQKTGEFKVRVANNYTTNPTQEVSAMTWSSAELGLGLAKVVAVGTIQVPCRSVSHLTDVTISTEDLREMNVLDIEYTLKMASRPERKRV